MPNLNLYNPYINATNIYQNQNILQEEHYPIFFIYKRQQPTKCDVLFTRSNKGEYKYCYLNNAPIINNYGLNKPPHQYTAHKADSYVLIRLLEYPTMCEVLPKIFIRDLLIFLANNA